MQDLTLPTFYFMCGHVFHEGCTQERDDEKVCLICYPDMKEIYSFNLDLSSKDPKLFQSQFDSEL